MEFTEEKLKKISKIFLIKFYNVVFQNIEIGFQEPSRKVASEWTEFLEAFGIKEFDLLSVPDEPEYLYIVSPSTAGEKMIGLKIPIETAEKILIMGL